ncbi:putative fasciclin-like arabinogalactan protein [Lupinus albus]|uniref:Putative fasciclin-like arabinogalactan protein n=1 Tax=Lupinus albus TaxID=3870 RepID=A0A6A4NQ30_LUPAL|nr:putative fasciclin-like arabinogalactan protein [Lupinus albus]
MIPSALNLMASETRPNLGLNITKALIDDHDFNVATLLLSANSVVEEFKNDEGDTNITLFIPLDDDLPPMVSLQSLLVDKKVVMLKFHVLLYYYPLGSLESIMNPVQLTLATETMGVVRFTLNILHRNDSIAINIGIVQATATQRIFYWNPTTVLGVSKFFCREIYSGRIQFYLKSMVHWCKKRHHRMMIP